MASDAHILTRRTLVAGTISAVGTLAATALLGGRYAAARGLVAAAGCARVIDRLTVHHTATPAKLGGRVVDVAYIAESHRRRGLGLGTGDERDCAYHFVIAPDGRVEPGRPLGYWGSGTRDGEDNLRSIAVALVGDFSPSHNPRGLAPARPTPAQLDSLENVALWAFAEHGFTAEHVRGHREVSPSECPGESFDLGALRARLRSAARDGRTGVRPPRREEQDS